MDGRKKCYSYFTSWDLKQWVLFALFQQQDMLKQVVVSNFHLYLLCKFAVAMYLSCCVMNYIGELIQTKNNLQIKVIMLKLSLLAKEMLARLYLCLR